MAEILPAIEGKRLPSALRRPGLDGSLSPVPEAIAWRMGGAW